MILRAGVLGAEPLGEGVADKQQSGENRHCLQGRFMERLAWERGGDFPRRQNSKSYRQNINPYFCKNIV